MIATRHTGDHTGRRARVAACLLLAGVLLLHASPARTQATTVLRQPSARLVANVLEREGRKKMAALRFDTRPVCDPGDQSLPCKAHSAAVISEVRRQLGDQVNVKQSSFSISPLLKAPGGFILKLIKVGPTDDAMFLSVDAIEYEVAADGETVTKRTHKYSETVAAR